MRNLTFTNLSDQILIDWVTQGLLLDLVLEVRLNSTKCSNVLFDIYSVKCIGRHVLLSWLINPIKVELGQKLLPIACFGVNFLCVLKYVLATLSVTITNLVPNR